jgi:hypothetical protein
VSRHLSTVHLQSSIRLACFDSFDATQSPNQQSQPGHRALLSLQPRLNDAGFHSVSFLTTSTASLPGDLAGDPPSPCCAPRRRSRLCSLQHFASSFSRSCPPRSLPSSPLAPGRMSSLVYLGTARGKNAPQSKSATMSVSATYRLSFSRCSWRADMSIA